MSRRRPLTVAVATVAVVAAALLLTAAPAPADWLVTRDGARLETEGPWEVKGKLVIFTAATGRLSSLPLHEVDLEASEELTAERAEQAQAPPRAAVAEPPAEAAKPVLVITEKDLPPRRRPAPATGDGDGQPPAVGDSEQATTAPRSLLTVSEWQIADESTEGIVLAGRLANPSEDAATAISLGVLLFDDLGKEVGRRYASLDTEGLAPGDSTGWNVVFPGVYTFSAVRFEPEAIQLRSTPDPAASEPAPEEGGGAAGL